MDNIKTIGELRKELELDIESTYRHLEDKDRIFLNSYFNKSDWMQYFPKWKYEPLDYKVFGLQTIDLFAKYGNFLTIGFVDVTIRNLCNMHNIRNVIEGRTKKLDEAFFMQCIMSGTIKIALEDILKYEDYTKQPFLDRLSLIDTFQRKVTGGILVFLKNSRYSKALERYLEHENVKEKDKVTPSNVLQIGAFLSEEICNYDLINLLEEYGIDTVDFSETFQDVCTSLRRDYQIKIEQKEKELGSTLYEFIKSERFSIDWNYLYYCTKTIKGVKTCKKFDSIEGFKSLTKSLFNYIMIAYFIGKNQDSVLGKFIRMV